MSESNGLMDSLKRLAGTMLAIVQTRLQLLSNELEEERLRITQMLLYGSVTLLFFNLALTLLTAFFVVLFWESHLLLVLGIFTVLYFIAGLLAWNALLRLSKNRSHLFSASLAELTNDRDHMAPPP